jgi:long-chain acyl-CoA synthetase
MIYTSGTAGRPKGVRRQPATSEMQATMTAMVSRIIDIRPGEDTRTVVTGPVYHSAPNLYALYAVRDGGLVILPPRFDAEDLLRQIERHRITHLHMAPTMFVRLLKLPAEVRRRYDLSSLRFVTHAGRPARPTSTGR